MNQVNATSLAERLSVTRGRISQYVSEGKLDGCYEGSGRARRFDLDKCAVALGRRLDPGQMMGNGASTRAALATLRHEAPPAAPVVDQIKSQRSDTELRPSDPDRYELARTQKAEEEARRMRRQNEQEEGSFVLASEAARQTARIVGQEIAAFETVLREGARKIADHLGVDYKTARQLLVETWRAHRTARSDGLGAESGRIQMTEAERADDI